MADFLTIFVNELFIVYLDNPFVYDEDKKQAQCDLKEIEEYERKKEHKRVHNDAKQKLSSIRRAQFGKDRPELILALINRDGYECANCSSQDKLTIDHIMPLSKGGTDELNNLRLLCQSCNSKKNDRIE